MAEKSKPISCKLKELTGGAMEDKVPREKLSRLLLYIQNILNN